RAALIGLAHCLLPRTPPIRRSARRRVVENRPAVGMGAGDRGAADEAVRTVVEIVAVVVVECDAERARRSERIEFGILEERGRARAGLIGVVAPDHTFVADRIIGLAD